MDMLVLKQEDRALIIFELFRKLQEEAKEVQKATYEEPVEKIAGEVFDVIQVCIGILDQFEKHGENIKGILEGHNNKLLERGWEYEKVIRIDVVGGESNGNT